MTAVRRVAYALGANLGDRLAALQAAVDGLAATAGIAVVAVSAVYATDPVGGPPGQPGFRNAVLIADIADVADVSDPALTPGALLARGHAIEQELGRVRAEHWGPRTLDIDLLAVGDETSDVPELLLPHPRAHERAFVLVPWADVDPDFVVPGQGRVADLLAALPAYVRSGVRAADGEALTLPGGPGGEGAR